MKRCKYWALAYAHVIRWAGPHDTWQDAAIDAYGVCNNFVTFIQFPSNPKRLSATKIRELHKKLAEEHEAKTGHKIAF